MIVRMLFINMCRDNECVVALEKSLCKLAPNLVRFLRRYLARLERLANMIREDVSPSLIAASDVFVLALCVQKFFLGELRSAAISGNELTIVSFVKITRVLRAFKERLRDAFSLVDV